jgi:hypothetical protein
MKIKTFNWGYGGKGFEINFTVGKYCLRIARYQFALWKNMNPIFNFLFKKVGNPL